MLARIGVMRALNRNHVREFNPDRKPHHWGTLAPWRCPQMLSSWRYPTLEYLPRVTIYVVARNVSRERGYEVHSKGNGHANFHCGGTSSVDYRVRIRADAGNSTLCPL